MSKYPVLNSHLENLSNLKGKAKIYYICSYIDSLAEKQINDTIEQFLRHKMVFSEVTAQVVFFYFNLCSQDEIKDVSENLTKMKYEVQYEVNEAYITFYLTK